MIQMEQIGNEWLALLDGFMLLASGPDYNQVKAQAEFKLRRLNE